jgi:hypothetical protein
MPCGSRMYGAIRTQHTAKVTSAGLGSPQMSRALERCGRRTTSWFAGSITFRCIYPGVTAVSEVVRLI